MPRIVYITGGARSGKSTLAEKIAYESANRENSKIAYIATAIAYDDAMRDRVKKHKERRGEKYITFECYKDFLVNLDNEAYRSCDVVLVDCITMLISDLFLESGYDFDNITLSQASEVEKTINFELDGLLKTFSNKKHVILVSNEVGLGVTPPSKIGNYFRDIQGRVNQRLARLSNVAYMCFSSIPLKIKDDEKGELEWTSIL